MALEQQKKKRNKINIDLNQYGGNIGGKTLPKKNIGRKKQIDHKMCVKCHEVLPLDAFHKNKGYKEAKYCDIYCKDCAKKIVINKDSARQYFFENNRMWSDGVWLAAQERAIKALATNPEYLKQRTTKKKRDSMLEAETAQKVLSVMGLVAHYQYVDNTIIETRDGEYDPASPAGMLVKGAEDIEEGMQVHYSTEWGGMFQKWELDYLDDYYRRLEEDFDLDNVNLEDYARKICKASLIADKKYNDMVNGKCNMQEWQKAQEVFDGMSKSARFAEAQRKTDGASGMRILCKIIEDIEINKQAYKPKVMFPKDSIDLILEDFAHTFKAVE